ncbi:hypothetical protein J4710_02745 [Staphylococcus xylosus]|uniref:Carrier domain-containing protein n=1 Tax=Staphylococcus xylosus TaxID=1288 RepID=A0A939ND57_STAXY|nr:hypothetical protein [Staphylococcus xylosus]
MGGHSLKAISVINEIESKTNKRLPLKKYLIIQQLHYFQK